MYPRLDHRLDSSATFFSFHPNLCFFKTFQLLSLLILSLAFNHEGKDGEGREEGSKESRVLVTSHNKSSTLYTFSLSLPFEIFFVIACQECINTNIQLNLLPKLKWLQSGRARNNFDHHQVEEDGQENVSRIIQTNPFCIFWVLFIPLLVDTFGSFFCWYFHSFRSRFHPLHD